jgi:DNA ligase (NAD+)
MRVIVQEKVDGISGGLVYENGIFRSLVTRGDGVIGDDITPHAAHIRGIPKTIPEKGTVDIRGEIVLPLQEFKEYWLPRGAKNPRNQV